MPSHDLYKKKLSVSFPNAFPTVGRRHYEQGNLVMEATWDNDIQSRKCYIYDYFHDDQPTINKGMTYEETTKTPIDIKFIVSQYQSLVKDRVEYHIIFRPSQPLTFGEDDDLFYYQTEFTDRYGAEFPIGMYIDIPDEHGVYRKWLICQRELGNQFMKYMVLPCNYRYHWIEADGNNRIKRKMWGVTRSQNSYNSGLWTDYLFTSTQNQSKAWLPLNYITEKLYYTAQTPLGVRNQRIVVSAPTDTPTVWQISKIENSDLGIQKITLYQDHWNVETDYIDKDDTEDLFAMYADYFLGATTPVDPQEDPLSLKCAVKEIKVNGSYRTITVKSDRVTMDGAWSVSIDGEDAKELVQLIEEDKKLKVKFVGDRSYLTKTLTISYTCNLGTATADLVIVAL